MDANHYLALASFKYTQKSALSISHFFLFTGLGFLRRVIFHFYFLIKKRKVTKAPQLPLKITFISYLLNKFLDQVWLDSTALSSPVINLINYLILFA